jgi:hypothetical protein
VYSIGAAVTLRDSVRQRNARSFLNNMPIFLLFLLQSV